MFESITSIVAIGGLLLTGFAAYCKIKKAISETQEAFGAYKSCQEAIALALADKHIDNKEIEQILKVLTKTNKEGKEAIDSWAAAKVEVMGLIGDAKKKLEKGGVLK